MIERHLLIPWRWWRRHRRDLRGQHQYCKVCGQTQEVDFVVDHAVWSEVVPRRWERRVVCLRCFEGFAASAAVRCVRVFLPGGP